MIEAFLKSHRHFRRNGDSVEGCVPALIDGCTYTIPVVIHVFSDAPPHVSVFPSTGIAVCPTPHVTAQGDVIAAAIPSLAAWHVGSGLAAVHDDLFCAFSSSSPIRRLPKATYFEEICTTDGNVYEEGPIRRYVCTVCDVGPLLEVNMEQHRGGAGHKRNLEAHHEHFFCRKRRCPTPCVPVS